MGEPTVEEIARAIADCSEMSLSWRHWMDEARAIHALYAPVLTAARREALIECAEALDCMADEADALATAGPGADVIVHREREQAFKDAAGMVRETLAPQQPREKDGRSGERALASTTGQGRETP